MKKYQRIDHHLGYETITTVNSAGRYVQYIRYTDGTTGTIIIDNVISMGWPSVADFLRHHRGFEEINKEG